MGKNLAGLAATGALMIVISWVQTMPAAAQEAGIARGQKIAQEKCSRCHAIGKTDTSPEPKSPPFRDIGKNFPLEHLAEALAEGIVTGDNNMPEFKFGPRDIDAILDYIAEVSAGSR